jgi:hypothetical protein
VAVRTWSHDSPVSTSTDIDMAGHPVRIEERIRRPRGRPKGARDSYRRPARSRHNLEAEINSYFVDGDWDDLGVG